MIGSFFGFKGLFVKKVAQSMVGIHPTIDFFVFHAKKNTNLLFFFWDFEIIGNFCVHYSMHY